MQTGLFDFSISQVALALGFFVAGWVANLLLRSYLRRPSSASGQRRAGDRGELAAAQLQSKNVLELAHAGTWRMDPVNAPDVMFPSEEATSIYGLQPGTTSITQEDWNINLIDPDKAVAKEMAAMMGKVVRGELRAYDMTFSYRRAVDNEVAMREAEAASKSTGDQAHQPRRPVEGTAALGQGA